MTYCVGVCLDEGMVFASDSRSNAGVDNVARFQKMSVYEKPGERVIVTLCAGNVSVTQGVTYALENSPLLGQAKSMVDVVELLCDALEHIKRREGPYLQQNNIDINASFIVGGQIAGEAPRLFLVHNEGGYVETTEDTPFAQIGETKYGKPIIDRVMRYGTGLTDATKCLLISFDSTMRSNLSVGLPIDLCVLRADELRVANRRRIDEEDSYFRMIHRQWGEGLRQVFSELPNLY